MQALVIRLNSGVQVIEEKVRRNQSFLNAAGAFEETCQAGSTLKMAYDGLDGSHIERSAAGGMDV